MAGNEAKEEITAREPVRKLLLKLACARKTPFTITILATLGFNFLHRILNAVHPGTYESDSSTKNRRA
jgi:hypothetical protein